MLPRWNTGGQAVSKAARVDWSTISSACSYLGSMLFPPLVGPKPPRYARSKIDGTALQRRSKARILSSRFLICPNPGAVAWIVSACRTALPFQQATGSIEQIQLYFQACTVHFLAEAPLPRPPLVLCGRCSNQPASRASLRVKLNLVSRTGMLSTYYTPAVQCRIPVRGSNVVQ